jgi:hypothetical protein
MASSSPTVRTMAAWCRRAVGSSPPQVSCNRSLDETFEGSRLRGLDTSGGVREEGRGPGGGHCLGQDQGLLFTSGHFYNLTSRSWKEVHSPLIQLQSLLR